MENLLDAARRLAAGRPDTFDIDKINDAVSYFRQSVTRHFLDEEGSVFPRLSTRRPELAEQLASLSSDHPTQVKLQDRIGELAAQLDGESRQGAHKELLELANQLAEAHRTHVTRLEHVFTIAKGALTAEDDAGIVLEMETRRERRTDEIPVARRQRSETIAERPVAKRAISKPQKASSPKKAKKAPAKSKAKTTPKSKAKSKSKPAAKKPKPKPKPKPKKPR